MHYNFGGTPVERTEPYRILSLDGGGIRGLISAAILEQFEKLVPGWRDDIDLIAGTSTGGIIALGLAAGKTPAELVDFYIRTGPRIFRQRWWDCFRYLDNLFGPRYRPDELYRQIDDLFGNLRLKDLNTRVLITAFDLSARNSAGTETWRPKFFHNFEGPDSDGMVRCSDVARYTSAAPTYFPSADGFVDGGVAANNPAMAALAQTQDQRSRGFDSPSLGQIRLLSLGTGRSQSAITGQRNKWGVLRWGRPLLNILFDGQVGIPDYQCRQLLGEQYERIDVEFEPGMEIALDEVDRLNDMIRMVYDLQPRIAQSAAWLSKNWTTDRSG